MSTYLLKPAPFVIKVILQKKGTLLGVKWRHDVKPAVIDKTFKGFAAADILFHGDRIDAVNGVPVANPRELVAVWRAASGAQVELTLQREGALQLTIEKPAASGQVTMAWVSRKSPLITSVQLAGGAAYPAGADGASADSLQTGQAGVAFQYSSPMIWPNDLLVAVNGKPASTPAAFDAMLAAASGSLVLSVQRDVEPPMAPDTSCGCFDFLFRTKPATRTADGLVVTTTMQNV